MKKEKLKEALESIGYSRHSIKSILLSKRGVPLEKAIQIEDEFDIPVRTWVLKTYLEQKGE